MVDVPDRTLTGEIGQGLPAAHAPLQHGDTALFFDATNRESLRSVLKDHLLAGPLVERYRLAKRGHLFVLRHHRSISRVDGIFAALAQVWAMWPPHLAGDDDGQDGPFGRHPQDAEFRFP